MKIYIAGKVTGLPYAEANRLFKEAEAGLKRLGHETINPMEMVDQRPGRKYHEYLRDALKLMLECQGIYLLPNWKDSRGARIEKAFAEELEILIITGDLSSDYIQVRSRLDEIRA